MENNKYPLDLNQIPILGLNDRQPLDRMDVEAKRNGKCKICLIGDTEPDFLHYIYALKFDINYSLDRLIDAGNAFLENRERQTGRQLDRINKSNLTRHFKSHVPVVRRQQYEMQKAFGTVKKQTEIDNAAPASKEYVEDKKTSGLNLFEELNGIYKQYKTRYEEAIGKGKDGNQEFFAISEEMRKILVDLNKMKQNEKIVGIVVKQLMHNHTEGLIRVLLQEVDKTDIALSSIIDNSDTRSIIVEGLKVRIGESLTNLATNSIEEIAKQYPIAGLH